MLRLLRDDNDSFLSIFQETHIAQVFSKTTRIMAANFIK